MVASDPESEPIMPRRNLRSRAYQLADDPESAETMQRSGNRGDNSQNKRWGLMGLAVSMARASNTSHHSRTLASMRSRQEWSVLRSNSGIRARNVSALSPIKFSSIG